MTVLKRGLFACAFAAGSMALAHCSGGGSSGGPGPVGDPPATATPIVSATPTVPGSSSAPTTSPAPGSSSTPRPRRSPQPTPTPTTGPTATPGPTETPTAAPNPTATPACALPNDPTASTAQLNGLQQTISFCYADFRANVTLPPNNGGGSTPITLSLKASDDKPLGAPASPGSGTPIYYESFNPDFDLVLDSAVLKANISSQTKIVPGSTYAANLFLENGKIVPTITGIVPQGHNIYLTFTLPQQHFTFPAANSAQIVLYRNP